MYFSKIIGETPEYKLDEYGNIVYDSDGDPIPTGTITTLYSVPVKFEACISSTLASAAFRPFGVDNSANKAVIDCDKDTIALDIGDIVWKQSEIEYIDVEHTKPDVKSANYVVKGIADAGLDSDLYLLQRLNNGKEV